MAVVACNEVTGREGARDKNANKRYTRVFQVLTDAPTDGAKQVIEHPGLPGYGDIWELVTYGGDVLDQDQEAFLVEKRPAQTDPDNLLNWTVYCEYVGRGDPTLEPPEIDWDTQKWQKTTQEDVYGVFVANSAGDPYQDGLTADRSRFTVTIRQNVLTWDPVDAANYLDTLNEQMFLATAHPPGFLPALCKLSSLGASAVWYESNAAVHYWRRTAKVEVSLYGWRTRKLDEGFNEVVLGERVPIILPGGGKPASPVPLDGAGARIAPAGTPTYREFDGYPLADWTPLNLEY